MAITVDTPAVIRFELPVTYGPALVGVVGLPVEAKAGVMTIHAPDPQQVLCRLTAWAEREGVVLDGLEIKPTKEASNDVHPHAA